MIDKIFIPTYGRSNKQHTFDYMPKNLQEKSVCVIAASEEKEFKEKNYPYIVCPNQGQPPKDADPLEYGLSNTRKWIAYNFDDIKYAVFDDDLENFVFTRRPSDAKKHRLVNTCINTARLEPGYEHHFDIMMEEMDEYLDNYVTAGLEVCWNIPREEDYSDCWRESGNHFYNGKTFPKDELDFTSVHWAEDFYILLQCLTKGYPNRINFRYRIRPSNTQAAGGCDAYRTIDTHNHSMRQLKEAFPDFVTLKTKIAKGGAWGGLEKLAATIQWKKAYKSSKQNNNTNTLEGFLT
jgi:hypothetical protein